MGNLNCSIVSGSSPSVFKVNRQVGPCAGFCLESSLGTPVTPQNRRDCIPPRPHSSISQCERVRETLLIKPLILSIRATHFMIWFNCVCMHAQLLSCVRLFATVSPVAHQTPLFMGLSRREYWSGLPFSPPGDRPNPKDRTHVS